MKEPALICSRLCDKVCVDFFFGWLFVTFDLFYLFILLVHLLLCCVSIVRSFQKDPVVLHEQKLTQSGQNLAWKQNSNTLCLGRTQRNDFTSLLTCCSLRSWMKQQDGCCGNLFPLFFHLQPLNAVSESYRTGCVITNFYVLAFPYEFWTHSQLVKLQSLI